MAMDDGDYYATEVRGVYATKDLAELHVATLFSGYVQEKEVLTELPDEIEREQT